MTRGNVARTGKKCQSMVGLLDVDKERMCYGRGVAAKAHVRVPVKRSVMGWVDATSKNQLSFRTTTETKVAEGIVKTTSQEAIRFLACIIASSDDIDVFWGKRMCL
ncbi:hypothetical protein H257_05424 [Aphanomyces astaci]|uniref:Uncharacterized protein n=1 Tax=Aphanomyces astaci TaxID=112090 RepID=W4GSI9_APHAT|nr:hypothetical protein H257_05424 [Aphanomyces astaci]ETV81863.1 hypothetical protein H257_05424 [Aphanomyces astaci]|eukprot:XP_009828600.1 hypothetical protein H257_05424 [Aphanomyces astaci]